MTITPILKVWVQFYFNKKSAQSFDPDVSALIDKEVMLRSHGKFQTA